MKKMLLLVGLLAAFAASAAEIRYVSLMGENRGVNLANNTTVTNGTVGYLYTNSVGTLVTAGQYAFTNYFTNASVIYTNYGPYQAGAFVNAPGMALSTGEPHSGLTFSSTVQGTAAGDTNTVTFLVDKIATDNGVAAIAGSASSFTWIQTSMGTTNQVFVTNAPAAFAQGAVAFRLRTIVAGSSTGGATNVVKDVGFSGASR